MSDNEFYPPEIIRECAIEINKEIAEHTGFTAGEIIDADFWTAIDKHLKKIFDEGN